MVHGEFGIRSKAEGIDLITHHYIYFMDALKMALLRNHTQHTHEQTKLRDGNNKSTKRKTIKAGRETFIMGKNSAPLVLMIEWAEKSAA